MSVLFMLTVSVVTCHQISAQPTASGGFPFFRSFLDGRMDDVEKPVPNNPGAIGMVDRRNKAVLVDGLGLRLTTLISQVGAFYLPSHPFTTNDGMLIEFEYMMYPTVVDVDGITDGICMFLVDYDKAENLEYGAEGGGFGYSYRWTGASIPTTQRIRGIVGGYLAIALDQSNFKISFMDSRETRNGIPYGASTLDSKDATYNTSSNVTIRGAAGPGNKYINASYSNMSEGYWGYPVLITRSTGGSSDPNNMRNRAGFIQNPATGRYTQGSFDANSITPYISQPFDIAGKGTFIIPNQAQYRKAIIKLDPNPNTSVGGFIITVDIQHGNQKTTVINKYVYAGSGGYLENGLPDPATGTYYTNPPYVSYSVPPPEQLVIGFMAATGTMTNYTNVIKNLRITLINAANSANDDIRSHRRGPVTIRPLDNDIGYKNTTGTITGNKDNLDPQSFRFWTDEYTLVQDVSGNILFEHSVPRQGKWVYDPDTGEVTFFPVLGFTGVVAIMYDINGKEAPYNQEKYRSSLATIYVSIDDNQPNP